MRFFLFTILYWALSFAYGQSDPATLMTVGVYVNPSAATELSPDQLKLLESRVINIISRQGLTHNIAASRINFSEESSSNLMRTMSKGIVCVPKFEIFDTQEVEGSLDNTFVVDVSLTLSVQYIYEDIIFSNMQRQIQGSGRDRQQAINNVIRNLRINDPQWATFLASTRENIVNYYDQACSSLVEQATQLDQLDLTVEALAILWPIPKEVDCYEEVKQLTIQVYKRHINRQCAKTLLDARTFLAANRYDDGLAVLSKVDPLSSCAEEANILIDTIAQEIDINSKENRNSEIMLRTEERKLAEIRLQQMEADVARSREPLFRKRTTME
jgi:hypothetical protein